ncbi:hypothetical protein EPN87_02755 [archaeon]|nr:MAG: hypothetical protein EPN87_02755 [archaeon]
MKEEVLIYLFVALSSIMSLSGGGFLLSMLAILVSFILLGKVKQKDATKMKRLEIVIAASFIILAASFTLTVLSSALGAPLFLSSR